MLPEERSDQAVFVGVGRAAEPEMLRRRLEGEIAERAADWSEGESRGWEERRRV